MPGTLSKYLDPDTLSRVADRSFEPKMLVAGHLAGAHKSPMAGFAVEFAGHREYVTGDSPKHIDWRVYYARRKLFVKQYELETNLVCHLVLDVSASMRYGEGAERKLLYGGRLAATLAYSIVRQSDKVSMALVDDRIRAWVPPSNSQAQIVRVTDELDRVEAREQTSLAGALVDLAGRIGTREIVVIFSDFFGDEAQLDALEEAIQRLRYDNHEVVLFQILHHDELTFDFEGMYRFQGLEDVADMLAQSEDIRDGYLAAIADYNRKLEDLAVRNRCDYVVADTSRPQVELFLAYLDRRERTIGR